MIWKMHIWGPAFTLTSPGWECLWKIIMIWFLMNNMTKSQFAASLKESGRDTTDVWAVWNGRGKKKKKAYKVNKEMQPNKVTLID